jgi:hypothetical protein
MMSTARAIKAFIEEWPFHVLMQGLRSCVGKYLEENNIAERMYSAHTVRVSGLVEETLTPLMTKSDTTPHASYVVY